jgi:hypothetical protein
MIEIGPNLVMVISFALGAFITLALFAIERHYRDKR